MAEVAYLKLVYKGLPAAKKVTSDQDPEIDFEELAADFKRLSSKVAKDLEMGAKAWQEVERGCRLLKQTILIHRRMIDQMIDKRNP